MLYLYIITHNASHHRTNMQRVRAAARAHEDVVLISAACAGVITCADHIACVFVCVSACSRIPSSSDMLVFMYASMCRRARHEYHYLTHPTPPTRSSPSPRPINKPSHVTRQHGNSHVIAFASCTPHYHVVTAAYTAAHIRHYI